MPRRASLDRSAAERLLAWLYTGPLGQVWGAVADITGMYVRWRLAQVRRRGRRD